MPIIQPDFRALIIGSSGSIGSAFLDLLTRDPNCSFAIGIHRKSTPFINYDDFNSIDIAANSLESQGPFHLIINTIGALHSNNWLPEKKLEDLNADQLESQFRTNTIGPVLTLKRFSKLLSKEGGIFASLSAKVGSIEDNRLGGWYSYRASKAALNMLIKTSSIELSRTKPNCACVALHPGTVNSELSKPFNGQQIGRPALDAAQDMLNVLLELDKEDTGKFFSYAGEQLPW